MDLAGIFLSFLEGEKNDKEIARMLYKEFYGKEAPDVETEEKEEGN